MASTGKKGKKNKGKTVALTDFLANTKRSWNDEIEEAERLIEFNRKPALPAAPRAARAIDESLIPKNPPYVAFLSNLSFEVDEKDIANVFSDLNISNVRLPREEHTDRTKGFGYVVFEDKLSFITALHMYEVTIKSRRVRIDIADQEGDRRRGGPKGGRDNRDSNYESERTSSDWRTGPRSDYLSNDKRGSSNRRDYSFRDKDGFRERDRDRDRDRDGGDRNRGFGDRETNWRDSDRRFSSERDREFRSGGFGGGPRRNYDDRNEGSNAAEPKTRRKIVLKPRTIPIGETAEKEEEKKEAAASIFGQAKPVDTAARERQIEERLARERELSKNDSDADRPKTRNDDYNESRRVESVPEPKERQAWGSVSPRDDHKDSSSQDINNGQVSDSEEAPSNQENDRSSDRDGTGNEETEKVDYKDEDAENDKSDGEGRYGRQNRSENRYNEKNKESDRSYRREEKYRDDRDRRDRDRRDYERRDRGYDSEGRGRDSVGKYREQDRERDREGDGKRYNDRDIDNRRYNEKEPEGRKYSSDRDGDSKRYPEREGGRHREQDDHGSSRTQRSGDKRGSASGDRGTRQRDVGGGGGGGGGGRGAPEKERAPPVKDRPKEPKKTDDAPRMPKFREAAAPNYVGTNKYCCLQEDGASE